MVKVLNQPNYSTLIRFQKAIYLSGRVGTVEDITDLIVHVQIVANRSRRPSFLPALGGTIFSIMAFGIFGLITAIFSSKMRYDVNLDIYLSDHRVIEIWLDDKSMIDHLSKYF